jgi:BirA family biotin operon repressor/biotin-[acetyl-CoA-carboxylase] ligase
MAADIFSRTWPVVRFGEIDSTNEEARRRAAAVDFGPCWLVADRQSAGRGRLGREWTSPSGNLFATALLAFDRPLAEGALACFSAGLAVIEAAAMAGVDASSLTLKWPNDVQAGDAKLAGVLIETGVSSGRQWMAAGFGVNIATAPARADRATARLADLPGGEGLTTTRYVERLDIAFRARLARLAHEGFEPTRRDWLARSAHLGARVEVSPASGRIAGVMRDLGPDGALVLEMDGGGEHHVRAGEISILG